MNINLHIDRLVLDNISLTHGQQQLLRASLEAELTRLLRSGALAPDFSAGFASPRINANAIQICHNQPAELGEQIARSVYASIGTAQSVTTALPTTALATTTLATTTIETTGRQP